MPPHLLFPHLLSPHLLPPPSNVPPFIISLSNVPLASAAGSPQAARSTGNVSTSSVVPSITSLAVVPVTPSSDLTNHLGQSLPALDSTTPTVDKSIPSSSLLWQNVYSIVEERLKRSGDECGIDYLKANQSTTMDSTLLISAIKEVQSKQTAVQSQGMGRMRKILKSLDKYSTIVDVAIQHHPDITALVWAGFRFILQVSHLTFTPEDIA